MNAEILQPGNFPKSTSDVLKLAENWVAPQVDTGKEDDSDDDVLSVDPGVDNNTCDHDDSDVLSVDPGVGDNTHDPGVGDNTHNSRRG